MTTEKESDTRLDKTVRFIETYALTAIMLIAYYYLSFIIIRSTYTMQYAISETKGLKCGMPILGPIIGHPILYVIGHSILYLGMYYGRLITKKHYWAAVILPILPIVTTFAIIFC